MNKALSTVAFILSLITPAIAIADTPPPLDNPPPPANAPAIDRHPHMGSMREHFKNMSPEERQAHFQAAKQKWDSLSPQEKEAFKQQNKDRLDKMQERHLIHLYGAQQYKKQNQ